MYHLIGIFFLFSHKIIVERVDKMEDLKMLITNKEKLRGRHIQNLELVAKEDISKVRNILWELESDIVILKTSLKILQKSID